MYSDVAVIIPARIGSTRLPDKPMQMIGDKVMIHHVALGVAETKIPNIFVATDSSEIEDAIGKEGFNTIMTSKICSNGTVRVYEAFNKLRNVDKINYVVNVQGDMPFIESSVILDVIDMLKSTDFDIVTSGVKVGIDVAKSESNVKIVTDNKNKALYFSRNLIPHGAKEFLYHVGIYGFKTSALEKFVFMPRSKNELLENLEQLRALDNGMTIGVCYSDHLPISVDTPDDLAKARKWFASNKKKV